MPGSLGVRARGAGVQVVNGDAGQELRLYYIDHAVDSDEKQSEAWWCQRRGFPLDAAGNVRGWASPTHLTGQVLPTSYFGVSTGVFSGATWPRFSFVGADVARTAAGKLFMYFRVRVHRDPWDRPDDFHESLLAAGEAQIVGVVPPTVGVADTTLTIGGLARPDRDDAVVFFLRGDGPYTAWYRVGWELDARCQPRGGWSEDKPVPGDFTSTGLSVAVVRRGEARHLVFYTFERTPRGLVGRYCVGHDVDANGNVRRWGPWVRTPGEVTGTLLGVSITVGDVNGDGRPDLVVLRVVDEGECKAVYQIGFDLLDLGAAQATAPVPLPTVFARPPCAVSSWSEGRLDLLGVGGGEQVYQKAFDAQRWWPDPVGWYPLGGSFAGPPRAICWGPGRLDIVGIGGNGAMIQKTWDGQRWWPSADGWTSLGGQFISPPTVASWAPNRLDLLGLGADAQLYHKTWDGQRWLPSPDGWQPLGGRFMHPVAAVCRAPNALEIFGVGTDGAMYSKAWWKSAWAPGGGDWTGLGGRFVSPPAATSWGVGRLDIVGIGADGAMWHKTWDNNRWWPSLDGWSSLGGQFISGPAIVTLGPGSLHLFALGTDTSLFHQWWNGHAWSGWQRLGGRFIAAPVAIGRGDRVDVFGLGTDGAMYQRWWTAAQGWQPTSWVSLGGVFALK